MTSSDSTGDKTRLDGKIVVVTGGANGMGERTSHIVASRGATVIILDPDVENSNRVVRAIESEGGLAETYPADVTDEGAIQEVVEKIVSKHGKIDVLDNNAAVLSLTKGDGTLFDTGYQQFLDSLRLNLGGPFLMCKQVLPVMIENGGGSVINIASLSGVVGEFNLTAYGATKAAVIQLTRSIATQFAERGIRCNAVAPSYVTTPNNKNYSPQEVADAYQRNTPSKVLVEPDDIGEVVAFLASEASKAINGHLIPVDNGLMAASPVTADFREAMGL